MLKLGAKCHIKILKAKGKWCDEVLNMVDMGGAILVSVGWTEMVCAAVLTC